MPFLTRGPHSIYYETIGETGPWICWVNGHTRSSRDFRLLARYFADQNYRSLIFDNRGSGQTQSSLDFSTNDLVEDILSLWDHCGIERSHLVGISMGGMLSQVFAASYPSRIDHLILVSTAPSFEFLASPSFQPWGDSLESVENRLKSYVSPAYYARNKLLIQAMSKQILASIQNENFESRAKAQHDAIKGLDNRPILGRIQALTLIIHGSDDAVIPVAAARMLAADIEGSELEIIEGGGHLLLAEDSKKLGQTIINFLHKGT